MIYVPLIGLPPTVNHAYFERVVKIGKRVTTKRILTKEGKKYKNETKSSLAKTYPAQMREILTDGPVGWGFMLDLPNLLNTTWPEAAKTRYKKLDVSNRTKLLEDALSDSVGMDDSQFLLALAAKREGQPFTHIWMWKIEEEGWIPHGLVQDLSGLQPHRAVPAL
jgi:hypothetical protein